MNATLQEQDIQRIADALSGRLSSALNSDPIQEIRFDEFCSLYIERHAKVHKKSWRQDERRIKHHLLPHFGERMFASITRQELSNFHSFVGQTARYSANRCLEILGKMYNLAKVWGYYPSGKGSPSFGITRFKEKSREVFVPKEQMAKVAAAIDTVRSYTTRVMFWCYFLTGLRVSELIGAKWEDLDISNSQLTIRDTKNGSDHVAALSSEALELLLTLPRKSCYIFPGAKKDRPLNQSGVFRSWDRVRKRAEIGNVTLHDLRRTTGSWLAQAGHSLHLIGRVLNHKDSKATQIYARFHINDVREALENHGASVRPFMSSLLGPTPLESFRIKTRPQDNWKFELLLERLQAKEELQDEVLFLRCLMGRSASEENVELARVITSWQCIERPKPGHGPGHPPFGWDSIQKKLVENDEEQRVRRFISDLYLKAQSESGSDFGKYKKIADELNDRRIPAKRGGRWSPESVRNVLQRLQSDYPEELPEVSSCP